jgi:hypothetical protein
LPEAQRIVAAARFADSFDATFLTIMIFAIINSVLAWILPLRRL